MKKVLMPKTQMSERYNSQNKPRSKFRKLLQERLDKVGPSLGLYC